MPDIFRAQVVGGTKIIGPVIAHEVDLMNYIGCPVLLARGYSFI